jgi:hypothetical protein
VSFALNSLSFKLFAILITPFLLPRDALLNPSCPPNPSRTKQDTNLIFVDLTSDLALEEPIQPNPPVRYP